MYCAEESKPGGYDPARSPEIRHLQLHRKPQIRVLIVAPDVMTGEFLTNALTTKVTPFEMMVSVGNADSAIRDVESFSPHLALISEELQEGPHDGFKVLQEVRRSHSNTLAVMLLKRSNPDHVIAAFRSGARGIFYRTHSFKALPKCLQAVHDGQIWIGNEDLRYILDWLSRVNAVLITGADGSPLLTNREQDVVRLVVEGMKNREVAETLRLTEHSIRNYLYRIFDKLGVSSRVELILYALSNRGGDLRARAADRGPEPPDSRPENSGTDSPTSQTTSRRSL
jgi:DNA-binding NarL/FixJ family response regulator